MKNRVIIAIITVVMTVTVFAGPMVSFANIMSKANEKAVASATKKSPVKAGKVKNLKTTQVYGGIKLTWKKSKRATRYIVYRSADGKTFKKYAVTKKLRYVNKKLKYNKKYYYKVKACVKKNGKLIRKSPSSAIVSATAASKSNYYNSKTAKNIINTGLKKVGCAYSLGAAGPDAFDCSGFVYWVLQNTPGNTVKPERGSATTMYYEGLKQYSIGNDRSDLRKGDIIMFSCDGSDAQMCHTGFYYGDNQVLHAGNYDTGVCIQSLDWLQPIAAIIRLP